MIALRLVRLIEAHSDSVSKDLVTKFRTSTRTAEMRNITETELQTSTHELLQHLSEWLLMKKTPMSIKRYRTVGASLRSRDIALAVACWAISMTKHIFGNSCRSRDFCAVQSNFTGRWKYCAFWICSLIAHEDEQQQRREPARNRTSNDRK